MYTVVTIHGSSGIVLYWGGFGRRDQRVILTGESY